MSQRNSILGQHRTFAIARAAEGASIHQIQRDLADRGCNVAWGTVNKLIKENQDEVYDAREAILRQGVGTYIEAKSRINSLCNTARELDIILDRAVNEAKTCGSEEVKNLKIVSEVWMKFIEGIRSELVSYSLSEANESIDDYIGNLDEDKKADLTKALSEAMDAEGEDEGTAPMLPDSTEVP